MVGEGADRVDGLLEGDFDLEADAVYLDDCEGIEREIRAEEYLPPPRGMLDEHEAHDDADRAPEQIERAVEQRDAFLPVDGAGRLDEVLAPLEAFAQDDFLAVAPGTAPPRRSGHQRQKVGDGVEAHAGDQVPAGRHQRQDDLGAGVVGVRDQDAGCRHRQPQQHGGELVELRAPGAVAEHDPFVDGARERKGEACRGRPHRQRHALAGVPEDVFGLGVALRLLVQLLHAGHLAPGLRHLDSVGDEDRAAVHRPQVALEDCEHGARPDGRETRGVDPAAVEHAQQAAVAGVQQPQRADQARHPGQVGAGADGRERQGEPQEGAPTAEGGAQLLGEGPPACPEVHR